MAEQMVGTVRERDRTGRRLCLSRKGTCPKSTTPSRITMDDGTVQTFEVEQQIGNNVVRTVSMGSTDGIRRGMRGRLRWRSPSSVPVGPATLGRLFNVVGDPIDKQGPRRYRDQVPDPPHRPVFCRAEHAGRDLRDGHQGHRPDRPLHPWWQDGHLRRRRRRQDGGDPGAHPQRGRVPLAAIRSLPAWASAAVKATT